jgi:hypothetical protein
MQYDLDTIQYLTNMFFRGVVEGDVIVCTTATGPRLLFTNAESATYVELDTGLKAEYADAVSHITKRLSDSMWSKGAIDPSAYLSVGGTSIAAGTLTNHTSVYNNTTGTTTFKSTP